MTTLIKEISKITKEGVYITLTKSASLREGGMKTNQWWITWDEIGKALFQDQYTDVTSVKMLENQDEES